MLQSLNEVELNPQAHVAELRAFLVETQDALENNRLEPDEDCVEPDPMKRATCRVQHQVERQVDRIFTAINDEVIEPFAKIDPQTAQDLKGRLDTLRADTFKRRMLNPDFWHTVSGKELFFTKMLEEEFEPFVTEISGEITNKRAALQSRASQQQEKLEAVRAEHARLKEAEARIKAQRAELDARRDALEAALDQASTILKKANEDHKALARELIALENDRAELLEKQAQKSAELLKLEDRLESIQSPFGTRPIGLSEAILAYPIVVAVGFVLCGLLLADAVRMRWELHGALRRWDPQAEVLDDYSVALMAPLWFEPHGGTPRRWLRVAMFSLPGLLFIAGIALIVYSWTLGEAPPIGGGAPQIVYILLYAGCFAVGVAVTAMLRRTLEQHDTPTGEGAGT